MFLVNTEKETAYSVGTIYCFTLIMHTIICGTFYYVVLKSILFESKDLLQNTKILEYMDSKQFQNR